VAMVSTAEVEKVAARPAFPITLDNISPNLVTAQYAVRGEIVKMAGEISKQLKEGKSFPFKKVVMCNIGNPQALGQKPITFFRQVLALTEYPALLDDPNASKAFPKDAIARARKYLDAIGSTGAYTESQGAAVFRDEIAQGMEARDGYPVDTNCLFMTDGASPSVHRTIELLTRNSDDAFLTPIPQYPLYSAALALHGAHLAPYYLDEDSNWGLSVPHLWEQVKQAKEEGKEVRALVVINPGNPTGGVLSKANQVDVVRFCEEQQLVLIADEVYQTNIYAAGKEFNSFKKIVRELKSEVPLVSMNSTSKGFFGECGRRGGYFEIVNFSDEVQAQLYKGASINLCSNLGGQIVMAMVMNPPQPGDESYELYKKERDSTLDSLKRRAVIMVDALNKLDGVTCAPTEGALYVFPQLHLPQKAVEAAKQEGKSPDFLYCRALLQEKGIVTVPGSGFKQADNTYHFRTTILPSEEDIEHVAQDLSDFHASFMEKYKD
jgi:alanine transaminase